MKIVSFQEQHIPEMTKIFMALWPGWSTEAAKKNLEVHLGYSPEYCFVVLDDTETCIGGIFCFVIPLKQGSAVYISFLGVDEKYRSKGIAKKLFQEVFEIAKENNIHYIDLLVHDKNEVVIEWYKRLGFRDTGYREMLLDV